MASSLETARQSFARVGCAVPRVALGDPDENVNRHRHLILEAANHDVDILCFPELSLTGYSCGDLFHNSSLLQAALAGLKHLLSTTAHQPTIFIVGLPFMVGDKLLNAAAICGAGRIWGIVPKTYLPTYGEFYEARWFTSARDLAPIAQVGGDGDQIIIGTNVIFSVNCPSGAAFGFGVEICEDLWVPLPPSTIQAAAGATVLFNLSASNITIGKEVYRRDLVNNASGRLLAAYCYCAAGHGESTADLAWDGHAAISERGVILVESERFSANGDLIVADVDLGLLLAERRRQTTFAQNAADIIATRTRRPPEVVNIQLPEVAR